MKIELPQQGKRVPQCAPGDFYVEYGACITCGNAPIEAPTLMQQVGDDCHHCYFRRQPQTPEEVEQAIGAVCVSETDAVRYGGTDQAIIRRIHELGAGRSCDVPLDGPPVPNGNARLPTRP